MPPSASAKTSAYLAPDLLVAYPRLRCDKAIVTLNNTATHQEGPKKCKQKQTPGSSAAVHLDRAPGPRQSSIRRLG